MTATTLSLIESLLPSGSVTRGRVSGVDARGYLLVDLGVLGDSVPCEVLHGSTPFYPSKGATVLVLHTDDLSELPVVLGQVGVLDSSVEPCSQSSAPPAPRLPDTLVLEAREELTLRVGDGSITLRADGKILIKGKDLVSHAQRTNRIKGGSVAIN